MRINPTVRMISKVLKTAPLSRCEMTSGWNNSGWLADVLYIYPHKPKKYTFEDELENKQREMKDKGGLIKPNITTLSSNNKVLLGATDLTDPATFMNVVSKDLLKKQEFIRSKQKSQNEEFDYMHNTHKLEQKSNKTKKKQTNEEDDKRKEINFNFDNWKKKFIYPYLKGIHETIECEDEFGFKRHYCGAKISATEDLINTKLLNFPLEAISIQKDYLTALQKPIVITIEELQKDLYKFQKDFPKETLP
jgi:hypothetical protein